MIIWNDKLIRARDLAREGHDSIGQKRKYNGDPYWTHTERVAATVASVGGTEDMIIAALYHDWIEDVFPKNPKYDINLITTNFGANVAKMVLDLTDVYTREAYPHDNRKQRHAMENLRLAIIPADSKTIKLADLIDNTSSIVAEDPDFARVYLKEKKGVMPLLKEGNQVLWHRAMEQVEQAKEIVYGHEPKH